MPNEAVSYNYFNLPLAEAYYKIGKNEKGRAIIEILIDRYFDELDYINSIEPKQRGSMERDNQIANQVVGSLYSLTNQYQEQNLLEKIETQYKSLQ
jgi:hypothetical protein